MNRNIKLLLVTLSALTFYLSSHAQTQSYMRRNIYGDFFGGMTFASMDVEGGNMYKKNKIGFMIGGNGNFKIYKAFHLQTGAYLIKKGNFKHQKTTVSQDGPIIKTDIKQTIDANYIELPLTMGFEIPINKEFRLNGFVGGYGALGFKGKRKQEGYTVTVINGKQEEPVWANENEQDTFDNTGLKKLDYGITGSIGVIYDIFILRLQYDHGLADVATDVFKNKQGSGAWRTRNYALCVGFRF